MVKSRTTALSNVAKRHAELRRDNKIATIFLYAWVGALFLSLVSCLLYVVIFEI